MRSTTRYRGRLAPSPTGRLHFGHARTFLVAWLRARQAGGQLVLRMEDIDTPRVVPGAAQAILDDLRWLGLDWDEGPDVGGPFAPYVQSARVGHYAEAAATLQARGLVYPCTCSRKDIQEASAPHGVEGLGLRYPGTCRERPSHPDRPAARRFRMPEPPSTFQDGLHGAVDTREWGGDFVVQRADGLWAYQLAVVVDDAAMAITEVVRGDDLLPSTPRQLALYAALDLEPPRFFHLPLVLGADGQRLSKRHGAASIAELRAAGLTPEGVVGRLAQSLALVDDGVSVTTAGLIDADIGRIPRDPIVA
jgi:glutamyl-tRNA synthetase